MTHSGYVYAGDNPVNSADPNGLSPLEHPSDTVPTIPLTFELSSVEMEFGPLLIHETTSVTVEGSCAFSAGLNSNGNIDIGAGALSTSIGPNLDEVEYALQTQVGGAGLNPGSNTASVTQDHSFTMGGDRVTIAMTLSAQPSPPQPPNLGGFAHGALDVVSAIGHIAKQAAEDCAADLPQCLQFVK